MVTYVLSHSPSQISEKGLGATPYMVIMTTFSNQNLVFLVLYCSTCFSQFLQKKIRSFTQSWSWRRLVWWYVGREFVRDPSLIFFARMSANLPYEIGKFQEHTKLLKQIKKDTNRSFYEIQQSGQFSRDVLTAYLPEDDYQSLSRVCDKPATIIVVGQTCYAKVCVINELLGEPVLPAVEELDCQTSWRMIRIKYGKVSNVSLTLPGSFELAAALNAYEGSWECVPRGDLELKGSEKTDPALASAVAEVSLNHALLKAGAEIVCSPSNNEADVRNIFQACCEDVLPIVLYAIEHDTLTEKVGWRHLLFSVLLSSDMFDQLRHFVFASGLCSADRFVKMNNQVFMYYCYNRTNLFLVS